MPTICFVRHGRVHNPDNVFYGRLPHFELDRDGRHEASRAGKWLSKKGLAVCELQCSPMLRARQTADAILDQMVGTSGVTLGMSVTLAPDLNEVQSACDGTSIEAIERAGWHTIYATEPGQGHETFADLFARVSGFIKRMAATASGDVVCVTHGDVCLCAQIYARGLPGTVESKDRLQTEGFYPQTASVVSLVVDAHGAVLGHSYDEPGQEKDKDSNKDSQRKKDKDSHKDSQRQAGSLRAAAVNLLESGVPAAVAKTVVAPVEYVKLVLQNQAAMPEIASGKRQRYAGILDCCLRTVSEQGVGTLFCGNLPNVIRFYPTQLFNMAFKDSFKALVPRYDMKKQFWPWFAANMLSGGLAGGSSLLFVYPLDFARTQLAFDGVRGAEREFTGVIDCLAKTVRRHGILSLYQGFGISCAGIVVYRAAYFFLYDFAIGTFRPVNLKTKWVIAQSVVAGAGLVSYPLDTVRRRLILQARAEELLYTGTMDCISRIFATEGLSGFFQGALTNVLRGLFGATVLLLYDILYDAQRRMHQKGRGRR
eukprot:Tamp_02011.p1 GENE.Tamp_02011~~Tamp_02011.p1  ORF type:complete len:538 (+),score=76.27 Tamp_02011:1571-3184(+)